MELFKILILVLSIVIAVASIVWSVIIIKKIYALKKIINENVVQIPLFKRSKWTHFSFALLVVCLIANIIYLTIYKEYLVCSCILVIIISLMTLLVFMMKFKCAILDIGVIVPYKFIPWETFYDYGFDDKALFICGDKKGFDTLTASTTRLDFDNSKKNEVIEILDKYKHNR